VIGTDELVALLADPGSGFSVTPLIDAGEQLGEGSIDLRLGPDIIVSPRATGAATFDPINGKAFEQGLRRTQQYVRRGIGDPFQLQPGEFVIARSLEYICLPDDVSAEARGRSSWGRLGLVIATATLIQPGFKGTVTLELANVGDTPLMLEVGLCIAQLTFARESPPPLEHDEPSETALPEPAEEDQRHKRIREWRRRHREENKNKGRYRLQLKPALSRLDRDKDLIWLAPMALRYAVGVVGERFAGKSTVISFLTDRRNFRLYRLSQPVYEEAMRRGVDPNDRTLLREIADEMRAAYGEEILSQLTFARMRADLLDADQTREPQRIVVEGFRVARELEVWQGLEAFRAIRVSADLSNRREWAERGGWTKEFPDYPAAGTDAEKDAYIRDSIDAKEPRVAHVLEAANGERLIAVNNDADVPTLHTRLDARVKDLDQWWRSREY
jgi:deoxycytidine triphosphate deaminase